MNYDIAKAYLVAKPEATEAPSAEPDTCVFKVKHKMYATLTKEDGVGRVNLKCEPEVAVELRETFNSVVPGYHMNKRHWNTVILDGSVPISEIEWMIDTSYGLVVQGMGPVERGELEAKYSEDELYGAMDL